MALVSPSPKFPTCFYCDMPIKEEVELRGGLPYHSGVCADMGTLRMRHLNGLYADDTYPLEGKTIPVVLSEYNSLLNQDQEDSNGSA